jgi:O-antigen/teichoic acid export membrane protein
MSLYKKIADQFLWRGLFLVTQFLVNVFISRGLGATLSGKLFYLLNNLSLIILVSSLCLESSLAFYGATGKINKGKLFLIGVIYPIFPSLITIIALPKIHDAEIFGLTATYMWLYMPSLLILGNISALFQANGDFKTGNKILFFTNLIFIFFLSGIYFSPKELNTSLIVRLYFLLCFSQSIFITFFFFFKNRLLNFSFLSKREILLISKYAFQALIANVIYFLLNRVDYWFVDYYCDSHSLGNYIQVSKIGQFLILPCIMLSIVIFPQSANGQFSLNSVAFKKILNLLIAFYLSSFLIVLIAGKFIITTIWGNDFIGIYYPLLITLPGIFCLAVSYLFSPVFAGSGKVKTNIYVSVLTLSAVILANLLLVPLWGINGAAISTSIGFAFMMILYLFLSNRAFGFSIKKIFS